MIPIRFHHLKSAGRSLAHARAVMEGEEGEETSSMERGSAVHALVFDTRKVLTWEEGRPRRGKDFREFEEANPGALILAASEYQKAWAIAKSVRASTLAMEVLAGVHEQTITWGIMGRACSGTPDVRGASWITDLKTTKTSEPERFGKQALWMAYHAQLAWYWDGVLASRLGRPEAAFIVAVESAPPYPVTVLRLTDKAIDKGRGLYHLWMERLLQGEKANEWPPYAQSIVDLDVPDELELDFGDTEAA